MYVVILICLALVLAFNYREIKQTNALNNKADKGYVYLSQLLILVGVFLRFIYLEYPYGINLDEAIAGYDAWCIAHYGVDQHLNSYPVYLKSWGSGQSALYAYLSAPLIYLFGLSLPVHRLPMAIVSSAGVVAMYWMIKKTGFSKFFIFLATLFIVFNPWHFTKSRWALDCNLAPDLAMIGTCFIIIGYYAKNIKKQTIYYALGFLFFGLTAYGYGVAWFMLPLYCLFILLFLFKRKKINVKTCAISLISVLILTFPLILFAFQLFSGGDTLSLGSITIPKLNEGRQESTNILAMNGAELLQYIFDTAKSLATGYDYLLSNSFPYSGQYYNPLGWIFILVCFIILMKKKSFEPLDYIFLFWLLACIPITLFVEYNVNRWNMLWFPLIYFCIRGVCLCIEKRGVFKIAFYISFATLTGYTALNYKLVHDKAFLQNVDDAVAITSSPNIKKVYFSYMTQYPPIIFYDPISPYEFDKSKKEINPNDAFIFLNEFGKYKLEIPSHIEPLPKTAYVIHNSHLDENAIDLSKFKVEKNETFTILWND